MSNKKNKKEKVKSKDAQKKKQTKSVGQQAEHRPHRWGMVVFLSVFTIVLSLFWFPAELHYSITETYEFSAEDGAEVNLVVLLPTSGHNQEVLEPAITWPGTWEMALEGRLNVLRLVAEIEEDQTVEAQIKYRVNLWQGEAKRVGDPVLADDLSPTEEIQSDDPEITAWADQLRVDNDFRKTAMEMFDFTIRHLTWPEEPQSRSDKSALTAFQTGIGEAREHANLLTALCRSADIPAHTVSGLVMPEVVPYISVSRAGSHPADAQIWAEVFIDDAWHLADPSWSGQFYKRDLFGWTDGKHLLYDTTINMERVYQSLVNEAESEGEWISAMSAPMHFVAWSEAEAEMITLSPMITLQKTWDSRLLMIASVILILVVLNWLYQSDRQRLSGK